MATGATGYAGIHWVQSMHSRWGPMQQRADRDDREDRAEDLLRHHLRVPGAGARRRDGPVAAVRIAVYLTRGSAIDR